MDLQLDLSLITNSNLKARSRFVMYLYAFRSVTLRPLTFGENAFTYLSQMTEGQLTFEKHLEEEMQSIITMITTPKCTHCAWKTNNAIP